MGVFRSRMMAVYEKVLDSVQNNRKKNIDGQLSIFEISEDAAEIPREEYPDIREFPAKMLLSMEKEMLGLYISGHPLSEYEKEIEDQVTLFSSDLGGDSTEGDELQSAAGRMLRDGMQVVVGGIVTGKKVKTTKSNNLMAFVTLEDLYGSFEVIVFPTVLEKFKSLLIEESIVLIGGRISVKEEEQPKIICDDVKPMKKLAIRKLYLKLQSIKNDEANSSLMALLKYFNGNTPVCFYNEAENKTVVARKDYWVNINDCLLNELKIRLGPDNVKVV
jgi:DNA polymerase-3 subunit alpha